MMHRTTIYRLAITLLVLTTVLSGCGLFDTGGTPDDEADAPDDDDHDGSDDDPDDEEGNGDDPVGSATRAYVVPDGDDLLFVLEREGTGSAYYYGEGSEKDTDITHLVLEDDEGFVGKVIFSSEGYPIHWLFDDQTFAVLATSERDPENAVHVMVCDEGLDDIELDLEKLLRGTIGSMLDDVIAEFGGEQLSEAVNDVRSAVDDLGWAGRTTRDVLDIAHTPSEQATSRTLALAGVAVGMAQRFGASAVPNVFGMVSQSVDYIKRIEEGYYDGSHIEGPTVSMLLCRGASRIPAVCHEFYVHNIPGNATKCGSACHVTIRCFTDICHPYEMSVERALAYRG